MASLSDIKKLLKESEYTIGTKETIKNLKLGKVEKVVLTVNCPQDVEDQIKHYADFSKTEIIKTDIPNEELGVICKKPFSISVLAFLKGGN